MDRAYSLLEIKATDDDRRIITGRATTPATDRMDDIVEPKGAVFKLPIPFLWQHRHDQPMGHVTAAKVSKEGIDVTIQVVKIEDEGSLKQEIDRYWQAVKSGLVRGLSIGFKPIESAEIDGTWGRRFTKWAWLELSAVTIPANAEATIATVKSCDERDRYVGAVKLVSPSEVLRLSGAVRLNRSK